MAVATNKATKKGLETPVVDLDPQDNFPVGVEGILASTGKLLAMNRGEVEPDERDALYFKRVYDVPKMMAERIGLDATGVMRRTMRQIARTRSLKPVVPNQFGDLLEDMITQHPLSSPLEEINPMHIVEQARRITGMGPGGIPSDDSISEEAQAVSPSSFGFISPIESPESSRAGVDTRLAWRSMLGSDGKIYQQFKNHKTGKKEWVNARDLIGKTITVDND